LDSAHPKLFVENDPNDISLLKSAAAGNAEKAVSSVCHLDHSDSIPPEIRVKLGFQAILTRAQCRDKGQIRESSHKVEVFRQDCCASKFQSQDFHYRLVPVLAESTDRSISRTGFQGSTINNFRLVRQKNTF
jgi:hypothetical protein